MPDFVTISIDAMGGDHGPSVVVPGLAVGLEQWRSRRLRFLLHGDQARIEAEMARHPALRELCEIRHTALVISGDEKPAQAMRRGKGSSLWNAVEAIREGAEVAGQEARAARQDADGIEPVEAFVDHGGVERTAPHPG